MRLFDITQHLPPGWEKEFKTPEELIEYFKVVHDIDWTLTGLSKNEKEQVFTFTSPEKNIYNHFFEYKMEVTYSDSKIEGVHIHFDLYYHNYDKLKNEIATNEGIWNSIKRRQRERSNINFTKELLEQASIPQVPEELIITRDPSINFKFHLDEKVVLKDGRTAIIWASVPVNHKKIYDVILHDKDHIAVEESEILALWEPVKEF